jgi:hypothetical protein
MLRAMQSAIRPSTRPATTSRLIVPLKLLPVPLEHIAERPQQHTRIDSRLITPLWIIALRMHLVPAPRRIARKWATSVPEKRAIYSASEVGNGERERSTGHRCAGCPAVPVAGVA